MAPPRSTGSAVLHFGLVSIPVKFYAATSDDEPISFHLLDSKTGSRLKQRYVRESDGELVEKEDMTRGFEVQKDQYVTFSKEETEQIEQPSPATIEVSEFIPASTIDPLHYDKAHHLGPDKGADRSYALLAAALAKTGRVALTRYSKKGRQHLALVRSKAGHLELQQLLRAELVRSASEIDLGSSEVMGSELDLAIALVESLSSDKFRPDSYPDQMRERTLKLIAEKVSTKKITIAPAANGARVIVDLAEALKASLGPIGPRKGPKKAPRGQVKTTSPAKAG